MAATSNSIPVIKVLFALHPDVDALDVLGPYEVFNQALHNNNDPCKLPFSCQIKPQLV